MPGDVGTVYQLRVVQAGISPMVWRRLLVPAETSIAGLHEILQLAACGLVGDDQTGLVLLPGPGAGIELDDDDPAGVTIYEGRHRVTAMRDVGVRRTVIQRMEVIPA